MNSVATQTAVISYRDKSNEELKAIIAEHASQPAHIRRYDCRGLGATIVLDERKEGDGK